MKKLLLTYLSILVAVYAILFVLGMNDDYVVEQKLWKIHQKYAEISRDPNVVPEQTFDEVAKQYQQVANRYPKSNLMPGVHLLIGDVYMMKKDYKAAREKFTEIIWKYLEKDELVADAHSRIGKAYELEENWAKALEVYKSILEKYPKTDIGLGIPIYIANYHKAKNDFQNTMSAYTDAISYYKSISAADTSSLVGFNARRLLATCYLNLGRWHEAIDALSALLDTYAASSFLTRQRAEAIAKMINVVAAFQLDDYDAARNVYKDFMTRHPNHHLSATLQKMIDAFDELDSKGVRVTNQKPNP